MSEASDPKRNVVEHVFLPRKTSENIDDIHQTQHDILESFAATVASFDYEEFPASVRQLFKITKRLHCDDLLDPSELAKQLGSMKAGDMLGIYVREQNCGVFIRLDSDDDATISTFQASLPNEVIYGDDVNGDIQVDYPSRALKIKWSSMLKSVVFAQQIHFLNGTQMYRAMAKTMKSYQEYVELRNVAHPMYVSQWLMAAVTNRSTDVNHDCPVISKKVRDEVIKGKANLPFRRSGLYMAIKVFAQLALTNELGAERGKFVYKLVLLKFMSDLANEQTFEADIVHQMLAKMARRIEKLRSFQISCESPLQDLDAIRDAVFTGVGKTIHAARDKMNLEFCAIQMSEQESSKLEGMKRLHFDRDTIHEIPKLRDYVAKRNAERKLEMANNQLEVRRIYRHSWQDLTFPDVSLLDCVSDDVAVVQLLADFEHWIFVALDEHRHSFSAEAQRRLATSYMSKAKPFYFNDCYGYSKMVLAMLKIIQIMDMAAVEECPLLQEYSSGINPAIIESLLLPSQFHLKIAQKVQIYFEDRNAAAAYPGLLEAAIVTSSSFSARYADMDDDMQRVRDEILELEKRRIKEKENEWISARSNVKEWREQLSSMECEYNLCYYNTQARAHSISCAKCSLRKRINEYKVDVYERPLKPEPHFQNAVVFELRMPSAIECLRDVLRVFAFTHDHDQSAEIPIKGAWTGYHQIAWHKVSNPQHVFLGSTTKLVRSTHYGDAKHPDCPFDQFVVDNGYNCRYYSDSKSGMPLSTSQQSVKNRVTFSVEPTSHYVGLQWTLRSTSHTQNKVLTQQSECPQELSLKEFVNFGSLRADGHRLQLRNLYRAIRNEGLSFQEPSVLALVLQALWECGQLDAGRKQWYREAHEDFADDVFAMEMITLLENYVEQQSSNWKHPMKLITATFIATRIFEINQHDVHADRIATLLTNIREIAIKWIGLITETIGKCCDENGEADLYANLGLVAVGGVLTYFVSRQHEFFAKIFQDGDMHSSVFAWLHFIVTFNNNMLLRDSQYEGIKLLLIRMVYNAGVNAEDKIKSLIDDRPEEVYKFIRFKWSKYRPQSFDPIESCSYSSQVIFTVVRSEHGCDYVQFDLISGEFLVNNAPVANLPTTITHHPLFHRVFADAIFEVQPSNGIFSTVHQYGGFNYSFEFINKNLIITEQRPNDSDRELIPPNILKNEIPFSLVEGFSHWWDKQQEVIEFRPKLFGQKDFSTSNGVQYKLDLNTRQLLHVKMEKFLFDIRSKDYQRIVRFLSRLEHENYIHVLKDGPAAAKVYLVRMDLRFVIDCSVESPCDTYDVKSVDHSEMRVSLNQTFGTLIGLRSGLMLEAIPTVNRSHSKLFIVPHGPVAIKAEANHVAVHVDLRADLRSPAFFFLPVDNECRQIKANNHAGWFYLAYLHAVTSHALADPFTRMTGTERALQILQSARVWSSAPYDEESFLTLNNIAALTPVRTFYPTHRRLMQQISWHDELPSSSMLDAYVIIVTKLQNDSQRLALLHSAEEHPDIYIGSVVQLNERDYARHLQYNPNWNISNEFVQPYHELSHFVAAEDDGNEDAVRQLSVVYDENISIVPSHDESSVFNVLMWHETLDGLLPGNIDDVIGFVLSTSFHNAWLRLYECARSGRLSREHFHLILTYFKYEEVPLNHLYVLHNIAANADEFIGINPPPFVSYTQTGRHTFERDAVRAIVRSTEIGLATYLHRVLASSLVSSYNATRDHFIREYEHEVSSITDELVDFIESQWPCDGIIYTGRLSTKMDVMGSILRVNPLLHMWNKNRKLVLFIREVEAKLLELPGSTEFIPDQYWPVFKVESKSFPKYAVDFMEKTSRNFVTSSAKFKTYVERARQIFSKSPKDHSEHQSLTLWWSRFSEMFMPSNEKHLFDAGLYPRLAPSLILPELLQPINEHRKLMIGAIAVITTREQRTQRIAVFKNQPQMEHTMQRECENLPHSNWMPSERPEWLLFEIEMNLSIRCVQVEIAERMIQPPGDRHSVMQLNMGEGKTAVIVPILAAVLANGNQLCSVTVLKSLFQTNLRSLRQCLGGLLNRRIYTFPCRRDMQIETVAWNLLNIYEECKANRGVVMTLPEYRLSFQLKIYEAIRKEDSTNADHFLDVHTWLNQNARHILDESDAILDAKYQLIYTAGAQLPPDGGALRWMIIQAVMKRVPFHMRHLFETHGNQHVEFKDNYRTDGRDLGNRSEVFRPCRLLNGDVYGELCDLLIEDFLTGELAISFPEVTENVREQIRMVLRDPNIGREQHETLMDSLTETAKETILILSGLLKFEVLKLSLMKRWRVNYGVKPGGARKMAVPFRAKDVAAEMTEFGHPDVALCLTCLSYYYSGLSDEQLIETFKILALTENPDKFYNEWIDSISRDSVPSSITSYNGINLSDPEQRDKHLFPLLRYNMHVIDYWLSNRVFPREAKIFENKLMCTAWDLCTERMEHNVTGFSGTNDTKLVLPMPIVQNDLPELEATNSNVRQILLRAENNRYRCLHSNITAVEILYHLIADSIPVLLDAGALMLELDNEQLVRKWLEMVPIGDYDAAIFFSQDDILMTIDRNGFSIEFENSVYRERLDRCLVYLDDLHTRGTDLKFPSGIRACVTLCGRITRDKTVQACMRMRMLGQGHTVSFYASLEADIGIRNCISNGLDDDEPISSWHVINYICNNSQLFEEENLVHWSVAGINYTQKLAAHKCFEASTTLAAIGERCTDLENTPLIAMYGPKEVEVVPTLAQTRFNRIAESYAEHQTIFDWINGIRDGVVAKLNNHIPHVVRYTQLLDEEQEKELEHELEEQREVSRPPPMPPATPHLDSLFHKLIIHGRSHANFTKLYRTDKLRKYPFAFARTTLFEDIEPQIDAFDDNIFVTNDFSSVVKPRAADKDDEFLRPVWWIVRVTDPRKKKKKKPDAFIVLSPFQCNELMPTIRASKTSVLHMFAPKLSLTHSSLLNGVNLQVPQNTTNERIDDTVAMELATLAGSIYFDDEDEETAYCNLFGLIPRPRHGNRSVEDQRAFEDGIIGGTGFVCIEHRDHFPQLSSRFTMNPDKIAIGIIERRYGCLSGKCHVSSLLAEGRRNF